MNKRYNKRSPLVSIVVVTYNSSRFITETLDSIAAQTYRGPIELIVSDDGSTDGTCAICRRWIEKCRRRFVATRIIKTPRNLGICGNYNFALRHVRGEWIKYIAGDDLLSPACIDRFMAHAAASGDGFLVSGVMMMSESGESLGPRYLFKDHLDSADPLTQARNIALHAVGGITEGPAFFIRTDLLRELGGMDQRYPMLEDMPFAFRCAFSGHHIATVMEPLVFYRIYDDSVSRSLTTFKGMYHDAVFDARMRLARHDGDYALWWHYFVIKMAANPCTPSISGFLRRLLLKPTDIYFYKSRLRARAEHAPALVPAAVDGL